MVCPGQPDRCVPCGQQYPFDTRHLEQSKTFPLPWHCGHVIFTEVITYSTQPKSALPRVQSPHRKYQRLLRFQASRPDLNWVYSGHGRAGFWLISPTSRSNATHMAALSERGEKPPSRCLVRPRGSNPCSRRQRANTSRSDSLGPPVWEAVRVAGSNLRPDRPAGLYQTNLGRLPVRRSCDERG